MKTIIYVCENIRFIGLYYVSECSIATSPVASGKIKRIKPADGFKSVVRRLECDEDKATFENKLGKIVRAKRKRNSAFA